MGECVYSVVLVLCTSIEGVNFSFHPRPQRGTETLSPSALLSEGWGYIPGLLAIGGDAVL